MMVRQKDLVPLHLLHVLSVEPFGLEFPGGPDDDDGEVALGRQIRCGLDLDLRVLDLLRTQSERIRHLDETQAVPKLAPDFDGIRFPLDKVFDHNPPFGRAHAKEEFAHFVTRVVLDEQFAVKEEVDVAGRTETQGPVAGFIGSECGRILCAQDKISSEGTAWAPTTRSYPVVLVRNGHRCKFAVEKHDKAAVLLRSVTSCRLRGDAGSVVEPIFSGVVARQPELQSPGVAFRTL